MKFNSKKNNLVVFFLITIFILGIVFGIVYYFKLPKLIKTGIGENLLEISKNIKNSHLNYFLFHNIIFLLIFFLSYTTILFPIILFYLFYEGVSLGFSFIIFTSSFKISGFFYALVLFIFTKLIYLLFIFYLTYNSYLIVKNMIYLFSKKTSVYNIPFKKYFKRLIVLIICMFIYDLFIYFWGNKILYYFKFLLK